MDNKIELKFKYNDDFAESFMEGFHLNNEPIRAAIEESVEKSVKYSETSKYLKQFENKPDTVNTQVDMYASLLEYVCDTAVDEVKKVVPEPDLITRESLDHLLAFVKMVYGVVACSEVISIGEENSAPLMAAYILERNAGKSVNVSADNIKKYSTEFIEKFNIPYENIQQIVPEIISQVAPFLKNTE